MTETSKPSPSAVAITCACCGESWDPATPGYEESSIVLADSAGAYCLACAPEALAELAAAEAARAAARRIR